VWSPRSGTPPPDQGGRLGRADVRDGRGQTVGEPDQIAAAHLYLMDNRFVTGTVLTVDGGAILL
jgi:NAD(P)-dependent dehydrogenase (short-subunit alcohol dehydrogenase family)